MEGVLVSAQKTGSPITVTVVSDEQGRFRFPDGRLVARPLHAAHPRHRLRSRRTARRRLGAAPADIAIRLAQDRRSCRAAHQHRMADEHARHGRREAAADRVHELPQLAAHRALDLHRRRVRSRCSSAWRNMPTIRSRRGCSRASPGARSTTPSVAQARRLSGDDQSQPRTRPRREPGITNCKPCRGRRAAPPMSSSPNTICRARPSRRMTCAPMPHGNVWYSDFVENVLGELDPKTGALTGLSDSAC